MAEARHASTMSLGAAPHALLAGQPLTVRPG
jgi:hypothetical protein